MSRIAALLALTLVVACGTPEDDAAPPTPAPTPAPTLGGVGQLPDTVPPNREPLVLVTRPPAVPESDEPDGEEADNVSERVSEQISGNRILVIGDSIMASTSVRYGGSMCAALVPLGWAVAVEAEPSRFVEFGLDVLDERLDPVIDTDDDWDAAVVHLGSNYRGDEVEYEEALTEILDRLAPRPTVLYTVTEYKPEWAEVNEVVRRLAGEYENVTLVDWASISEVPGVLSGDGLHPGTQGVQVLVDSTASAIGPVTRHDGECLDGYFTDDSGIGDTVLPVTPSRPFSGSSSGDSSGGSSGGWSSGSSGGSSGGGTYTPATTTAPVVTDPPVVVTDPPVVVTDPPVVVTDPPPPEPPPPDPPPPDPPPPDPPPPEPPPSDPPPPADEP